MERKVVENISGTYQIWNQQDTTLLWKCGVPWASEETLYTYGIWYITVYKMLHCPFFKSERRIQRRIQKKLETELLADEWFRFSRLTVSQVISLSIAFIALKFVYVCEMINIQINILLKITFYHALFFICD